MDRDGGVGGDGDESDAEGEGSSDGAVAAKLPRKLIRSAMSNRFSKVGTYISQPIHHFVDFSLSFWLHEMMPLL